MRLYLTKTGFTLVDYYRAVLSLNPEALLFENKNIAWEYLGLTSSSFQIVTISASTDDETGARYGFTKISTHLPKVGTGKLSVTEKETTATGTDVDFNSILIVGQQIKVEGQIRTVTKINSNTQVTVR